MDRRGGGSGEDSPESSRGQRRGKGGSGGGDGGSATAKGSSPLSVSAAPTATTSGHGGRRTPTYTGDFTQQSPNIHTRQAVILWLQETYGMVPNSGLSTPKEDVYKDYAQMCARDGKSAMARATFGKILHVAFPGITCNRLGRRGSTKHSYRWLHRQIPLSDDDESNNSPDGQRQTDSPGYPSAGHHSGGGSSALDSYPGYSLGSSMGLSRPAALSSQSPGSSSSISPSFASPSMAGGGSAATISGGEDEAPPSPIRLSTSLPPLPVYHPPFNPYPSAMHGGYPGSFAPSSSSSAYLMAATPSPAAPSSSLFHPISSPLQHRRVPSPPPHSYPSPYQQHLGSSYLSPSTTLQDSTPASGGWSSHVDSLLYDTSGGSGVTGAALDRGSAEQLSYSYHPNNSHHPSLPAVSTSTSPAGNLPLHYQSLTAPSPSSSGPASSSSLYPPLRPRSPGRQTLPPFPPPHHLPRHGTP